MMTHPYMIALYLILLAGIWTTTAAAEEPQPNVLFIAIDDMNDWTGFLGGHEQAITPNMDRLSRRGVNFTNAFCAAPACNPSRTSVMTGLAPSTSGVPRRGRSRTRGRKRSRGPARGSDAQPPWPP